MHLVSTIQKRLKNWQETRFLRKHGCKTWEQYLRITDPDYDARAQTVKSQFVGYPYLAHVNYTRVPVQFDPMFGDIPDCKEILDWCETNCRHKYRNEWERVIQDHFTGEYMPNGIGGTDELFFGFKDERDYLLFTLKWS